MTKLTKWLLGILIMVILVAAGFLAWQKMKPKTTALPSSPISTTDWKTYENKELGFSFKYPGNWIASKGYSDVDTLVVFRSPETQKLLDENKIYSGYSYDLVVTHTPGLGIQKFLSYPDIERIKETTLGGKTADIVKIGGAGVNIEVVAENNGLYGLSFERNDSVKLTDIENQIISTFKFTK